jgi:DNA-binding NarL/FixJ family response regulator
MKILVVEDDPLHRTGLHQVLELMLPDSEILESEDRDKAFQMIDTFRRAIDVVISDGHLGKHKNEGQEVLDHARAAGIPNLIFYSGLTIEDTDRKPEIHYLSKGTDIRTLENILLKINDSHQSQNNSTHQ